MTSFSTTPLQVDLNEAAKCVDILCHSHCYSTKYKMATIFGLAYEDSLTNL